MPKYKWTPEVIAAARQAAIAMAEFWDAMRDFEVTHDVEFDRTVACIESLASEVDYPPEPTSLTDESIKWCLDDMVEDCAEENEEEKSDGYQCMTCGIAYCLPLDECTVCFEPTCEECTTDKKHTHGG
jgi:hypothetical protein